MSKNKGSGLRNWRLSKPVAMNGSDVAVAPSFGCGQRKMSEFARESSIMIAANGDDRGLLRQQRESLFDVGPFWLARPRRVHQITHENNLLRLQLRA